MRHRIVAGMPMQVETGVLRPYFWVKQRPGPHSAQELERVKAEYAQKRDALLGLTREEQAKAIGTTRSTLYRALQALGEFAER